MVTKEQLKKEINEILKDADLNKTSAKDVRKTLEKDLKCNLQSRKDEIDSLVMEFVNSKVKGESEQEEESGESESESEEEAPKAKKAPNKAKAEKRKSKNSEDEESESEEFQPTTRQSRAAAKKPPAKRARKSEPKKKNKKEGSDSGSDGEWERPKPEKKAPGAKKGRGTGFTRSYNLSPALAALMGVEAAPRHEVVKKMWAIIKERNLYDPKNKQFAICDNDLRKVVGVKRFRTFGMLKYLRPHFID